MKKIRQWLVKEGMLKPRSLKETKELFNFPVHLSKQKNIKPIWMIRHLERIS
jgi:hypothetical protein